MQYKNNLLQFYANTTPNSINCEGSIIFILYYLKENNGKKLCKTYCLKMDIKLTQKRKRQRPVKKWSDSETSTMIDYILRDGNFEKPTARIYYRKLLEETNIDTAWDLVRCKMRNLKINFFKATKWRKSAETELDENEISDKLKILCPNYEKLKKIFGELNEKNNEDIYEVSLMSNQEEDSQSVEALDEDDDWYESILPSDTTLPDSKDTIRMTKSTKCTPIQDPVVTPKIATVSSLLQKTAKNSAISQLAAVQVGREAFYRSKLELERDKFKKYCEFEERKLLLEEKRIENDFKIQEKKLKLEELKLHLN